jgi:hypothetical protein
MTPLKLICENDIHDFDIIVEQKNVNELPSMKIRGPYIVCETKNLNGRIYKKDVMQKAVDEYLKEYVSQSRALGELNHPTTVEVNPENACHLVTDLKLEDKVWIGESRVLRGTPKGDLLFGLLKNGVKIGMSTRGVGNINESRDVDQYKLIAIDSVWNPSGKLPNGSQCFINGIFESRNFMINEHGEILEFAYNVLDKKLETLPSNSDEKQQYLINSIKDFINAI